MNTFKTYLKEYLAISTSEYVFDPNGYGDGNSLYLKIPISGPMFKRIWPDTIRTTVFHATTPANLNSLKKLEGKKKSISAFFSMDVRTLEGGVATDGGVVAELDADILISARDDIMSQVDKTGRRWVSLDWFENALGNTKLPVVGKVEKDLNSLIMTLVKKYLVTGVSEGVINEDWDDDDDWDAGDMMKQALALDAANAKKAKERLLGKHKDPKLVIKTVDDAFDAWSDMKKHLKGDGEKLRLVIKDYFDGVEKIIKKHKKGLGEIFYGYAKSKRQTDSGWDEQIVNNIKIKKVHVLKNLMDRYRVGTPSWKILNDSPFPSSSKLVTTWKSGIELEIYIRRIVKKEAVRK